MIWRRPCGEKNRGLDQERSSEKQRMKKISIVVPVYNEEENIEQFYKEICRVMDTQDYDFELIFIDDGSTDDTRVFVRDLDAEMDTDYAQEVDVIMGDCVAACRDLGMSLDDVQKCLELKIRQIKKAEGKDAEKNDDGTGRILTIEVGAKARRAQAGA